MSGKVPNRFDGSRILINCLKDNFEKLHECPTEEVIEQYAQAPPVPCRNPPCNRRPQMRRKSLFSANLYDTLDTDDYILSSGMGGNSGLYTL
ncbi:hypothetical protein GOBAR_AA28444 [Gossypium barbadense]|uniref:Uncharacterized protein n=1 Tax=Gossypium barbadense TaxID=3634 RepID=A0A2P5WMA8_GOSBA|nr:hypothetical protein GOBAR_AA28444 [Gossypium barbadense]